MNTKNLIDQINALIDQAPQDVVNDALERMKEELEDHFDDTFGRYDEGGSRANAKEILARLVKELAPARRTIRKHDFTGNQLEGAMFNIMTEISNVEERTDNPAVIDYAERLARKIMYATKNTTPDTCEH